jgi:hypothetical protein
MVVVDVNAEPVSILFPGDWRSACLLNRLKAAIVILIKTKNNPHAIMS